MPTLLVLDPVDGDALRALLMEHGHTVQVADTVAEALAGLQQTPPDLVVLDHAMEPSGLLLLSKLNGIPAIVCSREQTVRDRVACLRMGADDFVGKPYDPYELPERVDAVLRRSQVKPVKQQRAIVVGELAIDETRVTVTISDKPIHLTPIEFRLLYLLAVNVGEPQRFADLAQGIWGTAEGMGHTLEVHVGRIRRKVRHAGMTNPVLLNIRNVGYCLTSREEFSEGVKS